jgi:hypothetical protein
MGSISLDVVIEQKAAEMTPYVVIPAAKVARWKLDATTTIEGSLDGVALGRRSLKRRNGAHWFVELPQGILSTVGKSVGARARLVISMASVSLPDELKTLVADDAAAQRCWDAYSEAQKRGLREHILGAKSSEARLRRARQALVPATKPATPRVAGLPSTPSAITVRIVGRRLPGRTCGPYSEVSVGLPLRVGGDPDETIPADAREGRWEATVQIVDRDGVPGFRGRAVHGPPHERFLYLTWIGRKGQDAPAMFRRAKLRLDAVPASVLLAALRTGVLIGTLDLTACDGMPLAGSVRPPEVDWSSSS